jgi:hypothetical protein
MHSRLLLLGKQLNIHVCILASVELELAGCRDAVLISRLHRTHPISSIPSLTLPHLPLHLCFLLPYILISLITSAFPSLQYILLFKVPFYCQL